MDKLFDALKPYRYKYNNKVKGLDTVKYSMGIMAQDIRQGIIDSGEDPDDFNIVQMNNTGFYSVDYIQLIPILVKEIQDLKQEIKELKQNDS